MLATVRAAIHAAASMTSPLTHAILELAERSGDKGVAMGAVVDALEQQGFAAVEVEREVWSLLARRRLTPCGYVCRTLRRRNDEQLERQRVYEFLLVPWSVDLDQQLELELELKP